jgi:DNA polymerase-1
LIYNVFGFPVNERTESGAPAVDADLIEKLAEEEGEHGAIFKKLLERASDYKILTTYIIPILENQIEGRIYTSFRQTGTTSGRYSSGDPINLQTLPRENLTIKAGFVATEGKVLVSADYSSLEPRNFAAASGDEKLIEVYLKGEDLYSRIAIDVFGMEGVSAIESDSNYLKKLHPEKRHEAKVFTLAVPYGAGERQLSTSLGKTKEYASDLIKKYKNAFPSLFDWVADQQQSAIEQGFVVNLVGRRRRANVAHAIYKQFGIKPYWKEIEKYYHRIKQAIPEAQYCEKPSDLFYKCKNNLDNAVNFSIQSLAASICNAAMIDFYHKVKDNGLRAKIVLQVHDSITVECPKEEAEQVAQLLKQCMESNWVTKKVSVPMLAEPVISDSLKEDKA